MQGIAKPEYYRTACSFANFPGMVFTDPTYTKSPWGTQPSPQMQGYTHNSLSPISKQSIDQGHTPWRPQDMPQRDAVTSRHLVVTHDSLTYVISLFPETPLSRWRQAPSGQSQLHALAPSLQAPTDASTSPGPPVAVSASTPRATATHCVGCPRLF
ncbi:hypothetical protein NP493_2501g00004 [Ridgeia piscesae]|uniref:Uncharacterized protein n=1 Tax=Ridgeia piscesae TaxID=27915 RepID=A0AAD9N2W1_RIDPI|nr:hypothetical protein NP493_2501g00004 [Ridgeia piscesae]